MRILYIRNRKWQARLFTEAFGFNDSQVMPAGMGDPLVGNRFDRIVIHIDYDEIKSVAEAEKWNKWIDEYLPTKLKPNGQIKYITIQ